MTTASKVKILPSLDGVRGLAILLVIAHNVQMFDAPNLGGFDLGVQYLLNIGWIGVQLFFVLSGFLITGILLDSMNQPNRFKNFFARRTLRIFPLYYGALFIAFIVLPFLGMEPEIQKAHPPQQIWFWTYLLNWSVGLDIGASPFPHFWSLAVEEQFYLVWPLLIFALRTPRRVAAVCVLLAVISLACRYALLPLGVVGYLYEWTICRMDALALGGLAAAIMRIPQWRGALQTHRMAVIGLIAGLFVGGFLWTHGYNRTSPRGMTVGYSVLAISFAALVYACATIDQQAAAKSKTSWWHTMLSNRYLQSVGKYSYGMYIIHKPLHDFYSAGVLRMMQIDPAGRVGLSVAHYLAVCGITYILAWLVYHLYEVHFLRMKAAFV